MTQATIILVDGENLVARYESMKADGLIPRTGVVHDPGCFVWHTNICHVYALDIMRVSYYSTFVGDDDGLEKYCEFISKVPFTYEISGSTTGNGTINPHIFKKTNRSTKAKSVDINITIDSLRHVSNRDVRRVILCSGDGDYQPLIKEIMHNGVIAHVAAFSNGCHPKMKYVADDFTELDDIFFENAT